MRPEIAAILAIFLALALAEFFRTNLFHKPLYEIKVRDR
jgi:hypothetical protein